LIEFYLRHKVRSHVIKAWRFNISHQTNEAGTGAETEILGRVGDPI